MARTKEVRWDIYLLKKRPAYVGMVEAATAEEALERAFKEFQISEADKFRLSAQRR
jgi:hypothetical protein